MCFVALLPAREHVPDKPGPPGDICVMLSQGATLRSGAHAPFNKTLHRAIQT